MPDQEPKEYWRKVRVVLGDVPLSRVTKKTFPKKAASKDKKPQKKKKRKSPFKAKYAAHMCTFTYQSNENPHDPCRREAIRVDKARGLWNVRDYYLNKRRNVVENASYVEALATCLAFENAMKTSKWRAIDTLDDLGFSYYRKSARREGIDIDKVERSCSSHSHHPERRRGML